MKDMHSIREPQITLLHNFKSHNQIKLQFNQDTNLMTQHQQEDT